MKLAFLYLIFCCCFFVSCKEETTKQAALFTQIPDPKLSGGYVSNPDGILDVNTIAAINKHCIAMDASGKAQVAVVVVKTIGELVPKDFAHDLFNHWNVGDKVKNNGLLVFMVEDVHRVEFETGYGIEGDLPDITCFNIQQDLMIPYAQKADYDGMMLNGIVGIEKQLNTGSYDNSKPEDPVTANGLLKVAPVTEDDIADSSSAAQIESADSAEEIPQNFATQDSETPVAIDGNENFDTEKTGFETWMWAPLGIGSVFYLLIYGGVLVSFFSPRKNQQKTRNVLPAFTNKFYNNPKASVAFLVLAPWVAIVAYVIKTGDDNWLLFAAFVYAAWCLFYHVYIIYSNSLANLSVQGIKRNEQYEIISEVNRNLQVSRFVFPLPLVLPYSFIVGKKMQRLRYDAYTCDCGSKMHLLDEKADDAFLQKYELAEEKLKSVDYDVWQCDNCQKQLQFRYENYTSKVEECKACKRKTLAITSYKTLEYATTSSTGRGVVYYTCGNCGAKDSYEYVIPKESKSSSGSSSSSSGGSSSSSSSSSWGGGSSGGGGAGSSW